MTPVNNQGVALSQPGIQRVPAPPAVGTGGTGDTDVLIDVRKLHAGGQQLLALGLRVAARQLGDSGGGWGGRSRRSRASPPLQLVRIALYLCEPPLNKLKGVTCGPVSQTRVCEHRPAGAFGCPPGNRQGNDLRSVNRDYRTLQDTRLMFRRIRNEVAVLNPVRILPGVGFWLEKPRVVERESHQPV